MQQHSFDRPTLNTNISRNNKNNMDVDERECEDAMEDLRRGLLETIPVRLLDASRNGDTNTDADLDRAMAFLDHHADKKAWRRRLVRFVALKEAREAPHPGGPDSRWRGRAPAPGPSATLTARPALLEEMLLADGPAGGNYDRAEDIYDAIAARSEHVPAHVPAPSVGRPTVLRRLALAVALVHAAPVAQTHPAARAGAPAAVDPVRRYLAYERAYLAGELDPDFGTLTTWELTHVVDGDEPDEVAAWGRRTLRNFYPDHALTAKLDWRYSGLVRTDVPYGSARVKDDDPQLHKYQNILRNGGICGRRAFFGRFILRAFGIPTTARPSRGHGALCHWTPGGTWVVNLGGGWGAGWTKTRYVKDVDFEAMTRARRRGNSYTRVKVAQWIGELFDERRVYGIHREKGKKALLDLSRRSDVGLWYRLSLRIQETILADAGRGCRGPVAEAPPANGIERARRLKPEAGACSCAKDGQGRMTLTIPAVTYANPRKTKDVKVMTAIQAPEDGGEGAHCRAHDSGGNQQIYLPPFVPQGLTVMRGGTWKSAADACTSGHRLKSGGYGKYDNWGLRAAVTLEDDSDEEDTASCPRPNLTLELGDGVAMEFVYVPPGTFVMGGESAEDGRFACVELPHHPVTLTRGFYLGKYPVRQDQWVTVMGENPSKSTKGFLCPVDNVGVEAALGFCLAAAEATGADVRLPTEAEWEYASRGTTNGTSADPQWFFGSDASALGDYAWFQDNADGKSHPVGLKKANPFGLHDIYGNVLERVSDTYSKDYYQECAGSVTMDPAGPSQGTKSQLRYNIEQVPEAGDYLLTAVVCTINSKQRLRVSVNGDDTEGRVLGLPYTVGDWGESAPVPLRLERGNNTLHVWRDAPPQWGISIREFVLTKTD